VAQKNAVYERPAVVTAEEAKNLLLEGNKRFNTGLPAQKNTGSARRLELKEKGQKPFAVVLTCSDSRVPPEVLFDQSIGDLFVVRNAGNILDPVSLGSIEYAVDHLHTPLVVVLGHDQCGAVKAAVDGGEAPGSIGAIIKKIKPIVEKALASGITGDGLYARVEDENIQSVVAELKESPVIKRFLADGKVTVAGAKYYLGPGEVKFV
jgi:carbonic anhydrase